MNSNGLKRGFIFSRKEINGLFIFCILLVAIIFTPTVYGLLAKPEEFSFREFKREISVFQASLAEQKSADYYRLKDDIETREFGPQYFEFNPNNLSAENWGRLGLSAKQVKVIKNYEAKGGRFYRKEDLKRIFSISERDYERLEPYIKIPGTAYTPRSNPSAEFTTSEAAAHRERVLIELNTADSATLESINGIGPAFASRIIKYRNRLGGFYAPEQLKEVYGIDAERFKGLEGQVSVDAAQIRLININTADFNDLRSHPYLTFKQINAIIQYRKQHGNYSSSADLRKIVLLNEGQITKLTPYLTFKNDQQ